MEIPKIGFVGQLYIDVFIDFAALYVELAVCKRQRRLFSGRTRVIRNELNEAFAIKFADKFRVNFYGADSKLSLR